MFEHRLGVALGKSLAEIRALPYPEFRRWQIFYTVEPWGWWQDEYQTAALLSMLYNANRGKNKSKPPAEFMRKMVEEVLKELTEPVDPTENMTHEQKREYIKAQIKKDFGIR